MMLPQVVRPVSPSSYPERKPEKRARNMKNLSLNLNEERKDETTYQRRSSLTDNPASTSNVEKTNNTISNTTTFPADNNTSSNLPKNHSYNNYNNLGNGDNLSSPPYPNEYKTTILNSSPQKHEVNTPHVSCEFVPSPPRRSLKTRRAMFSPVVLQHDDSLRYIYDKNMSSLYPSTENLALLTLLPLSSCETQMVSTKFFVPEELQEQNVNAYPDGPRNVLNGQIFLYLDPKDDIDIREYDLVVNVARECLDLSSSYGENTENREYMYIPWTHTSLILRDLPALVRKIDECYVRGSKVLVHCQCGVSRLACVIVAYYMYKFGLGANEAYEILKLGIQNFAGHLIEACDRICPNMLLIFELMEFGDVMRKEKL